MKPLRPGTTTYETAIGRAIGAYINGASLEEAARSNRIHPVTLHNRMKRAGIRTRPDTKPNGRNRLPIDQDTFDQLLDQHPRLTPRQIADLAGISKTCVVKHLKLRGTYQPRPVGSTTAGRWAVSLRNRHRVLQAVALREQGYTHGQIAIRLKTNRRTVQTWLRTHKDRGYLWQRHPIPPGMWHQGDP